MSNDEKVTSRGGRPVWLRILAVLLAVSASIAAPAAESGTPPAERKVSLDYEMGGIREVFADVARQAGLELDADSGIGGKVTMRVVDAPLKTVMDKICESFRCVWSIRSASGEAPVLAIEPKS